MKKKSVVVLLTVTMVTEMTAAGCGDKQLALATDRVSVELGYELNTDVAAYVADADIAVEYPWGRMQFRYYLFMTRKVRKWMLFSRRIWKRN